MKLSVFLKKANAKVEQIITYKGKEALEAVKRNGYALSYVKEQTPEVCLEAVKRNGYALRYVNINVFKIDIKIKI